jgi:hypothetical protein
LSARCAGTGSQIFVLESGPTFRPLQICVLGYTIGLSRTEVAKAGDQRKTRCCKGAGNFAHTLRPPSIAPSTAPGPDLQFARGPVFERPGGSVSDCLNLMELFGSRYTVRFDPAYDAWHRPADCLDPWAMLLRSRFGVIFPHGRHVLAVEAERPSIRKQLDSMDCCRRYLDGERFGCWLFHLRDFERVAQVIRPARKRGWTGEDRRQAADRLMANLRRPIERRELSRFSCPVSTMTGQRD